MKDVDRYGYFAKVVCWRITLPVTLQVSNQTVIVFIELRIYKHVQVNQIYGISPMFCGTLTHLISNRELHFVRNGREYESKLQRESDD